MSQAEAMFGSFYAGAVIAIVEAELSHDNNVETAGDSQKKLFSFQMLHHVAALGKGYELILMAN